jgi:hypothetical protein
MKSRRVLLVDYGCDWYNLHPAKSIQCTLFAPLHHHSSPTTPPTFTTNNNTTTVSQYASVLGSIQSKWAPYDRSIDRSRGSIARKWAPYDCCALDTAESDAWSPPALLAIASNEGLGTLRFQALLFQKRFERAVETAAKLTLLRFCLSQIGRGTVSSPFSYGICIKDWELSAFRLDNNKSVPKPRRTSVETSTPPRYDQFYHWF